MFKRFLLIVTMAFFICTVLKAESGESWYIIDSFQVDSFLITHGFRPADVWKDKTLSIQGKIDKIIPKVEEIFKYLESESQKSKKMIDSAIPLSIVSRVLGFKPYKNKDAVQVAIAHDSEFFFEQIYAGFSVEVKPNENKKIACADLYTNLGILIKSYFKEFLSPERLQDGCKEFPAIHVYMRYTENESILMVATPKGDQSCYLGYDHALKEVMKAKMGQSWISLAGKSAVVLFVLASMGYGIWKHISLVKQLNELEIKVKQLNELETKYNDAKAENTNLLNLNNEPKESVEVKSPISDLCKDASDEETKFACTAYKSHGNAIGKFAHKIKELSEKSAQNKKLFKTCENNLENAKKSIQEAVENNKKVLNEKESFLQGNKKLNETLITCQEGIAECENNLETLKNYSQGNSTKLQIVGKQISLEKNQVNKLIEGFDALMMVIKDFGKIKKDGELVDYINAHKENLTSKAENVSNSIQVINATLYNYDTEGVLNN